MAAVAVGQSGCGDEAVAPVAVGALGADSRSTSPVASPAWFGVALSDTGEARNDTPFSAAASGTGTVESTDTGVGASGGGDVNRGYVAVSGLGDAQGWAAAVSGGGDADSVLLSVSRQGHASGPVALSGGSASGYNSFLVVGVTGDAYAPSSWACTPSPFTYPTAVSGTGNATGCEAVSVTGDAYGGVAVAGDSAHGSTLAVGGGDSTSSGGVACVSATGECRGAAVANLCGLRDCGR